MTESPFQKAYEFEERYGIERLKITIEKAETAYKTYQPETIGLCKNILESICKAIIEEKDETYSDKENSQTLVGKTLGLLNINSQISGGLCNIIGGCSQIAKGIGEERNNKCITGHGATNKKPLPTKSDINICVSVVLHIIDIIYTVIMDEKIDISTTKIKFEKIDEVPSNHYRNQFIDNFSEIDYDSENGVLFLNGAELRPSEILYTFDRTSYKEMYDKAFGSQTWEELYLDDFQDMISEEFSNLCEHFVPGHYGYEPPIINICDYNLKDDCIECSGNIETTVTIGLSNDGEDFSYCSNFIARFSYSADELNLFQEHNLEELILEKTDWL